MKNSMKKMLEVAALEADPTDRLCERVMVRIERRELARLRRLTFAAGLLSIAALIAFIPAIRYLVSAFVETGFGQYLSLFASDGSYVIAHWNDFAMSVMDSLPIPAVSAIVALAMVCVFSARQFARYLSGVSLHERLLATVRLK